MVNLNNLSKITGIYMLFKKSDPKQIYIGQAVDIYQRWFYYFSCINGNIQNPTHISLSLKLHKNDWCFSILEICSPNELNFKERFWIEHYLRDGYSLKNTILYNKKK